MMRRGIAAAVLAALLLGVVAPSAAQTRRRPVTEPSLVPTRIATPVPFGPTHIASGVIVRINGSILVVLLRNRRPLRVDATDAIARGAYSAPLFVGKVVIVEGRFAGNGTLFATTVTRLSRIDATTPLDR